MFVGVLFAAPGCESDGAATTADATGGPTEPGGATAEGDRCEAFLDETRPEPCDLEGFDVCQIFNKGEPTPQFSAQVVFTMPTVGPIAVSLSL